MFLSLQFIIVGMDSGRIVVLDADGNKLPGREYSSVRDIYNVPFLCMA